MDDGGGEAGFSLLEFLVTLMILGIVIAAVGSTIARRDNKPSAFEAGQAMQSMILRARSDAILGSKDTRFAIDTNTRRYAYPADATPIALPDGVEISMTAGGEFISDDESTYFLMFRPDGSSSGAEIVLSEGSGSAVRIDVNWLTGVPRIVQEHVL